MFSRILCCALCACVVSPAAAQFGNYVIQDGDYYSSLGLIGQSLLMTGGRVDNMDLYIDHTRIEGGSVGSIVTAGGLFDISGGHHDGGIFSWRFRATVDFEGYGFRARRTQEPRTRVYSYLVEGTLADGNFISFGLLADGENGANIDPTFTLLEGPFPGDVNGDFTVDLADLNTIRNNFGLQNAVLSDGDLTGDGSVGLGDLNEVRNVFGYGGHYTLGPEYDVRQQPVPEPSSLALTALALFALAGTPSLRRCCSSLRRFL